MKLGIMQPYFFPYLGHFALIAAIDRWVVFDVVQYTPKAWINRNRILHPQHGWQYVTVPLANSSISTKIVDARVLDLQKARDAVIGKMTHYRKWAPFYKPVVSLVKGVFDAAIDDSLVHLNVLSLKAVCDYLEISFDPIICSETEIPFPEKMGPGDWALEIASHMHASAYVNPIGGRHLFSASAFAKRNIALLFSETKTFTYDTSYYGFEPDLSIIDVLMWNPGQDIVRAMTELTVLTEAPRV
jgi:hypothetical protein